MAHQIEGESLMYVGDTPWHGIGHRFIEPPTIDEAIEAAHLDWEVAQRPLYVAEGIGSPATEEAQTRLNYRVTDGKWLGEVGPSYKVLQNRDAFKWFESFLESGQAVLECAGSLYNGRRIFVLAKVCRPPIRVVGDDFVIKYVLLSHAHDGSLAIRAGFTPIRVVCANTLQLAVSNEKSALIAFRHVGDVKANLEKVKDAMNVADAAFEATAEQYRFLATIACNEEQLSKLVKIVLKPGAGVKGEEKQKKAFDRVFGKVVPIFEHGRGNDLPGVKGTMWAAYNALTEYTQWERPKGHAEAEGALNSAWYGDARLVAQRGLAAAVDLARLAA